MTDLEKMALATLKTLLDSLRLVIQNGNKDRLPQLNSILNRVVDTIYVLEKAKVESVKPKTGVLKLNPWVWRNAPRRYRPGSKSYRIEEKMK